MEEDSQNEKSMFQNKTMYISYIDASMNILESFLQKWNSFNSINSPNSNHKFKPLTHQNLMNQFPNIRMKNNDHIII